MWGSNWGKCARVLVNGEAFLLTDVNPFLTARDTFYLPAPGQVPVYRGFFYVFRPPYTFPYGLRAEPD
jgi:hypothetical protein